MLLAAVLYLAAEGTDVTLADLARLTDVCSNIQSIFIRDICRYFFQTRGIKELEVFAPQCEVLNKTKILMLDEVFDEYIRKYLEGKQDEK